MDTTVLVLHICYFFYWKNTPSIETHLAVVRGLPTKKFLPKCVNEKTQLSVAAKVVRPTDLLNNVRY